MILGYNTPKSANGENRLCIYNNLTDRCPVFTVNSRGSSGGTDYISFNSTGATYIQFAGNNQGTNYWQVGNECSAGNGKGSFTVYANATIGAYIAWGGTSWNANSDVRLKKNIKSIEPESSLDIISNLNPVRYVWKSDEKEKVNLGLIAQEVVPYIPEVVNDGLNGYLGIAYSEIIPHLIGAIKQLKAELEDVKLQLGQT